MATVKEQINKLTTVQQRLAVWEALVQYLDESFISRDGRPPEKAIKVPNCLVDIVEEDILEEILQSIGQNEITRLKQEIESIENANIEVREVTRGN